jgi:catechol 2,3-dioxygenase-like lactoylglutathione lyase family enzyme
VLNKANIVAFLATADAERARTFYRGVLGLSLIAEEPYALVFDANGVTLRIAKVEKFDPARHTVLGWSVRDLRATTEALNQKGVVFERYPGLAQDENGIWTAPGGTRVAWFKDPEGNLLSVSEG